MQGWLAFLVIIVTINDLAELITCPPSNGDIILVSHQPIVRPEMCQFCQIANLVIILQNLRDTADTHKLPSNVIPGTLDFKSSFIVFSLFNGITLSGHYWFSVTSNKHEFPLVTVLIINDIKPRMTVRKDYRFFGLTIKTPPNFLPSLIITRLNRCAAVCTEHAIAHTTKAITRRFVPLFVVFICLKRTPSSPAVGFHSQLQ